MSAPPHTGDGIAQPVATLPGGLRAVLDVAVLLGMLLLASPVWWETDIYRAGYLGLAFLALAAYVPSRYRIAINWAGYLCYAWSVWVGLRYLYLWHYGGLTSFGSSEGIYLMPFFYITLGYAMLVWRHLLWPAACLFMAISFGLAALTVDLRNAFDGDFHEFFFTNNRIHASVGGGFVILCAINFVAYVVRAVPDRRMRLFWGVLGAITMALCIIGLFGAKSKGVWAAVAIAFAVQILLALRGSVGKGSIRRGSIAAVFALLFACTAFVWMFHDQFWRTLEPSLEGLTRVLIDAAFADDPVASVRGAIESHTLPVGTNARLMLWYNAVEIWSRDWLLGAGIAWSDLFASTRYHDVGFTIVHNGYLEIAMRYGIVGLVFYGIFYAWTVAAALRAVRRGLVAPEAFNLHVAALAFFCATIVTNANNRLAIGEAYMAIAGAFGFYCMIRCQYQDWVAALAATDAAKTTETKP